MRILIDNVNLTSSSGPNSFARKLANNLSKDNEVFIHAPENDKKIDIQLSFIQATKLLAPMVQRLDGIYFNSQQDWESQNEIIKKTFDIATGVIYQSRFNKDLTERYFGKKENSCVIHNGTDISLIKKIPESDHPIFKEFESVWMCASSWRPHKRLSENIRYFLEVSGQKDCLIVAGNGVGTRVDHPRIFYTGAIGWEQLISLYKKSDNFILGCFQSVN